ncbi:uncharacterized protein LOC112351236 [Selaginella moellendorffii]|uniref:uncharacterized protein LOC112351236 n=1 Tax=Selaginella moellendorffii TaxID=88036 RepID=UPI000D1CE29C|nr:uncharacterized protein LOC112351236 [Selaginella moellendorffii]|eukprot:XP_024544499.1 uncharacterized protein LOC112351236 [Selaginella moellendorffii]
MVLWLAFNAILIHKVIPFFEFFHDSVFQLLISNGTALNQAAKEARYFVRDECSKANQYLRVRKPSLRGPVMQVATHFCVPLSALGKIGLWILAAFSEPERLKPDRE